MIKLRLKAVMGHEKDLGTRISSNSGTVSFSGGVDAVVQIRR